MKVLDVQNLESGLETTVTSLKNKRSSFQNIDKAVREIVQLDDAFTGQGAAAIKSFYADCHQPFIAKFQQVVTSYENKLKECKSALQSAEPSDDGLIRQSFLKNDLTTALSKAKSFTSDITDDVNQTIASLQDITAIPYVNDSTLLNNIDDAKETVEETNEKLTEFDTRQASSLNSLKSELQLLNQYILELDLKMVMGQISIANYSPVQLTAIGSRPLLMASMQSGPIRLDNLLYNQNIMNQQYIHGVYQYMGLNYGSYSPQNFTARNAPDVSGADSGDDEISYLAGNTVKRGDFTIHGGTGMYENNWSGYGDGDGLLGGKSSFSVINVGVKHDTSILDSSFSQDMLKANVQASVGGESIFPLLKADGNFYSIQAKTQLDEDIMLVGRTGVEAGGNILNAKAYAGVDNNSLGVAAKASVAEGEVSGIIPIPFTDYNVKGTVGASALGVGGEAKIGKETVLDLRFILGLKLGISFNKQD
ncbi:MAG TPA: LXG domain-containing protein [Bacillaceae bacterium]